jgi:hypothetical protein
MWARADQPLVMGIQARLANTMPATPADRLCEETPITRRMTATTMASMPVPTTARVNRRIAGPVPLLCAYCRAGRNRAADPSGAATIPASNIAWSMMPFTAAPAWAFQPARPSAHSGSIMTEQARRGREKPDSSAGEEAR